jgi:hypothetical protein
MKVGNIFVLMAMIMLGIGSNSTIVKLRIEIQSDKDNFMEVTINRRFTK